MSDHFYRPSMMPPFTMGAFHGAPVRRGVYLYGPDRRTRLIQLPNTFAVSCYCNEASFTDLAHPFPFPALSGTRQQGCQHVRHRPQHTRRQDRHGGTRRLRDRRRYSTGLARPRAADRPSHLSYRDRGADAHVLVAASACWAKPEVAPIDGASPGTLAWTAPART